MAFAGDGVEERSPEQTAVAMFAAARGYHRREDKPFWWAHFDRLNNPVDEWGDTSDVFLADAAEVVQDWHLPSSRARKQQRWVKLTGTLAAGGLDSSVFALYEPPAPAGLADNPDRRAAGNAEIIGVDDPNIPTEVTICEREPKDGGTFTQLPFALTPGRPFPTGKLRESIDAAAAERRRGPAGPCPPSAIVDILLRRRPAHPQRRTAAAHRRYRRPTSRPRCSTSTRPTWRCTARPAPARPTRRPGSSRGW